MDQPSKKPLPRGCNHGCLPIGILAVMFGLCLSLDSCVSKEIVQIADSPDGGLRASITETNGGATTSFGHLVDVEGRSFPRWRSRAASFYAASRSDCADGVNLHWLDNDSLLITYQQAENANVASTVWLFDRKIRVISKSGVTDRGAKCGGGQAREDGKIERRN